MSEPLDECSSSLRGTSTNDHSFDSTGIGTTHHREDASALRTTTGIEGQSSRMIHKERRRSKCDSVQPLVWPTQG